jgi:cytochrome c-type biogenesis protein CcmH/NrfF
MILCTAVWSVLDQYEAAPMGVPSASNQFLVLLVWFFPVSMALLAMVWFRRTRKRSGREAM